MADDVTLPAAICDYRAVQNETARQLYAWLSGAHAWTTEAVERKLQEVAAGNPAVSKKPRRDDVRA